MCLDRTLVVQSCAVVMSHVSIRVKQLFRWAPLRAPRSRMSTCWWYRALEPLYCRARYSLSVFPFFYNVKIFFKKNLKTTEKVSLSLNQYQGNVFGTHSCRLFVPPNPVRNLPKVRRNPRRTGSSQVFAAVKKMAPSSREATGP